MDAVRGRISRFGVFTVASEHSVRWSVTLCHLRPMLCRRLLRASGEPCNAVDCRVPPRLGGWGATASQPFGCAVDDCRW